MTGSGSALQSTTAAQDQDQEQDYANRRGAKRGNRRMSMKKCAASQRARNQAARESRELHWFQLLRPWAMAAVASSAWDQPGSSAQHAVLYIT